MAEANNGSVKTRARRADVAREAGVSPATVSYVLNHTKKLSPEVERRVFEIAEKLNYQPDRIAQSLAGSRSHIIALLTSDISNAYQLDVIKGMQAEALKNDYIVYIFDASGDVNLYINHLISRRIDGIFASVAPDFMSDELLCRLRDANICVLTDFSRNSYLPDVSYITTDKYGGMSEAVSYLKNLGHRNIGYLSAFDESCSYDDRLAAFRIAMKKAFNENDPKVVLGTWPYSTSEELGEKLMGRMLAEHPEITAVIATNDIMAIGALHAIAGAGKRVPEDISVIGIDNLEKSATCTPSLTTLDQNGKAYGAKIFHVLQDNITQHSTGKYIIPMKLIERESTGKAPQKG